MDPLKAQPPQEAKLHFLDYWRIIRIRKTVILAVFLLVVLTATLVTFILPESFSSTARIKIERDSSDIEGLTKPNYVGMYDPYFIQTEFEVIQSELILSEVVRQLDLINVWGRKYAGGEKLKMPEAIMMLKMRMDLRPVRNTSLITITVYSEDPNEAAKLANTIAQAYHDHRLAKGKKLMTGGIDALKMQFDEQEQKVRQAQKEVDRLREELNISDADANGNSPAPQLEQEVVRQLQAQLIGFETQLVKEGTALRKLEELSPDRRRDAIQTSVGPDPELATLLGELNIAEQRLLSSQKDYAPDHPTYQSLKAMALDSSNRVTARVEGVMTGLSNRVSALQASVDNLKINLETARANDIKKAKEGRPYYEAKRRLEEYQRFQTLLSYKMASEKIDVSLPRSMLVEIVDQAEPGIHPVRPKKALNIALGIVIGLVVGVGLAFFIEYLDTSVKTIDDVERTLQAAVLGVIPQNVGYLIEEGSESPHAEAYRVLRTNLLFSRKDDKLNTVAVVSAGAGEGKSTTVLNLATVFAQSGQRVLVVDSDLRRPTLHKVLRVTNTIGLTNYLLKQNTLEEVIQTTSLPSLDFMASGKLPSSSLGILSSNQMKDVIGELKQRYDFVFFDSPPIMGVSDASILASEVDMTLQIIQYRRYPQPMNIRAKQLIEKVGGNLVGIVLNNINMSQDESYYYYSGYYHDYYSKNEETVEAASLGKDAGDKAKIEIKQKY
jgi:capsular exopolysaccharide synthesis family protein